VQETLIHVAKDAVWAFVIFFVFAVIGVVASVRWVMAMVTRGTTAVQSEARKIEDAVTHRGDET